MNFSYSLRISLLVSFALVLSLVSNAIVFSRLEHGSISGSCRTLALLGPIAVNDDAFGPEESTITGSVATNDSDPEGDLLTYSVVSGPVSGVFTLQPNGNFSYLPIAEFNGFVYVTYQVCDPGGLCAQAVLEIAVTFVNDIPVAADDMFYTVANQSISQSVIGNDFDLDIEPIFYSILYPPAQGTASITTQGVLSFTPAAGFTGDAVLIYQACDPCGSCDIATVTIHVAASNQSPVAGDDYEYLGEDGNLSSTVTANDVDPEGGTLTYSIVSSTTHGSFLLNANGSYTYTPSTNYHGLDMATYSACDVFGACDNATITFDVAIINDYPIAVNDDYTTSEDVVLNGNVSLNDYDVDIEILQFAIVSNPAHGSVVVNTNGTFTYTPTANYNGPDSFIYAVIDPCGAMGVGVASITINAVNDAPTAIADNVSVEENNQVSGSVATNDSDLEGNSLTFSVVTGPAHGTLQFAANGTFTYTPTILYVGADVVVYQASDGLGGTTNANLNLNVYAMANVPPIAGNDSFNGNEDQALSGNVSGNDTDANYDAINFQIIGAPVFGDVTMSSNGFFIYTPDLNYYGSDSFTYAAIDPAGEYDVAQVSITLSSVNDVPVAVVDAYTAPNSSTINGNLSLNDSDADGDDLMYSTSTSANGGLLTLNLDGSFSYTPNYLFEGTESFSIMISDGNGGNATSNLSIAVTLPNYDPTAGNDVFTSTEDTALSGSVSLNDSDLNDDVLNYAISVPPLHGDAVMSTIGSFTYTPDADYNGADTFSYLVSDGVGGFASALVSITISAVNDAPVAQNDLYQGEVNAEITGNVGDDDSDADGDALTFSLLQNVQHGLLVFNADGSFSYTPSLNYYGTDLFVYSIADIAGAIDFANVEIHVLSPNNQAPNAVNDNFNVDEDGSLSADASINDSDPNGDDFSFSLTSDVSNGTLSFNTDGTFTYTPDANFNGTDSFSYNAIDVFGAFSWATVSLTVISVNDVPVAIDDSFNGLQETLTTGNVSLNDTDADGEVLTYTMVSGPSHGVITLNPDGSFSYLPNTPFIGYDYITYQVTDGSGASDTAQLQIYSASVNNTAPFAIDDNFTIVEDSGVFTGSVATNDYDINGEIIIFQMVIGPNQGTASVSMAGLLTYTPPANFSGSVQVVYAVNDPCGAFTIATVYITVTPVNDLPIVNNDAFTTNEDQTLSGNVRTNDSDIETAVMTYNALQLPTNGTLTLSANGLFSYVPNSNYFGTDVFTYTATDAAGASASGVVTITISSVNDLPLVLTDSFTISEDQVLSGDVSINDSDSDSPIMSFSINATTTNGSVTLDVNGTFTYTPNSNYFGSDQFFYAVSDGIGTSIGQVNINVSSINDSPLAQDDSFSGVEDQTTSGDVASNDSDIESLNLSFTLQDAPNHGTVALNSIGTFVYTPYSNYFGLDSFAYQAQDANGGTASAIVSLSIINVNDAPIAVGETVGVVVNESVSGSVNTNDSDADGDMLTYTLQIDASNGAFIFNSDGSYTYLPNTDFIGDESVQYSACDASGLCSSAILILRVVGQNTAPVANDDEVQLLEDELFSGNASTNDTDTDGDVIGYAIISNAQHGSLSFNSDGSFTYQPDANFNGQDQATYQICDLFGICDDAIISIQVASVNDTPIVLDEQMAIGEDGFLQGDLSLNDFDPEGQPLIYSLVASTQHGTIEIAPNGTFLYTPTPNYFGPDHATYLACDSEGLCLEAQIAFNVTFVNDQPVAVDDAFATLEGAEVDGSVAINDYDLDLEVLVYSLINNAVGGIISLLGNGSFSYLPNPGFSGVETLNYTVCDPCGVCDVGTLTFYVNVINNAPFAGDTQLGACQNEVVVVSLQDLVGDEDEGNALLHVSLGTPEGCTAIYDSFNQNIILTGNNGFVGNATLAFQVCDNGFPQLCDNGSITINFVDVAVPIVTQEIIQNVTCFGDQNGSIAISASGLATVSYSWSNGLTSNVISGLALGTYSLTISDNATCANPLVLDYTITGADAPLVIAGLVGTPIIFDTPGGSSTYEITGGVQPYSYSWTNANGEVVSTEMDYSTMIEGAYLLTVTDANGCSVTQSIDVSTSIVEIKHDWSISASPNPMSSEFVLQLIAPRQQASRYEIVDMAGNVVRAELMGTPSGAFTHKISMANYAAGIYTLRVWNGAESTSLRIVKL